MYIYIYIYPVRFGSGSVRFIVNRDESDIRFSQFQFIPVQIHAGSRGERVPRGADHKKLEIS